MEENPSLFKFEFSIPEKPSKTATATSNQTAPTKHNRRRNIFLHCSLLRKRIKLRVKGDCSAHLINVLRLFLPYTPYMEGIL